MNIDMLSYPSRSSLTCICNRVMNSAAHNFPQSLLSLGFLLGLLSVLGMTVLSGCKPKPPVVAILQQDTPPPPAPTDLSEQKAAVLAEQAKQSLPADKKRLNDQLLNRYPGTKAAGIVLRKRAQDAFFAEDVELALGLYEHLFFHHPSSTESVKLQTQYAHLLVRQGRYNDAIQLLESLYAQQDEAHKHSLRPLLRNAYEQTHNYIGALTMLVAIKQDAHSTDAAKEKAIEHALWMGEWGIDFTSLKNLWPQVKDKDEWRFIQPLLMYKLAKLYYHTRDYDAADDLLSGFIASFPDHPLQHSVIQFKQRLAGRFVVKNRAIGILLPLSGRYQKYGERSLTALELALKKDDITLIVKDSKADPITAVARVEELVLEDHVIAIIGPLFAKSAIAAAMKAEELSVPMLSLSHHSEIAKTGPHIFRTALTVAAQARALAQTAVHDLGLKTFALLHPRSHYGREFAGAFWDEINLAKGEIRAVESYEHNQTTFRDPVRRMIGRWFFMARKEYIDGKNACRAQKLSPMRSKRCYENNETAVLPTIDFDAIVIPDSGKNISMIAPALAFEDIVLTHDEEKLASISKAIGGRKVHSVTLLGGSTWNNARTVKGCEQYCENAVFVDGYYSGNPSKKNKRFIRRFKEATGATPFLAEAQAFDTAVLLKRQLAPEVTSRQDLQKKLLAMPDFYGITGKLKFDRNGDVIRELFTLTITKKKIVEFKSLKERSDS